MLRYCDVNILAFYSFSSRYSLREIVLHLAHLGYQISLFNQLFSSIPAGDDQFDSFRFLVDYLQEFIHGEQFEVNGDICFIENYHIILSVFDNLSDYS